MNFSSRLTVSGEEAIVEEVSMSVAMTDTREVAVATNGGAVDTITERGVSKEMIAIVTRGVDTMAGATPTTAIGKANLTITVG